MSEPELSISLLTFNRLEVSRRCVESVLAHTENFELLVTDNASADGTRDWLRQLAASDARIRLRLNSYNAGFIHGHNDQVPLARGQFVCILNDDVEVGPGWARTLCGVLQRDMILGAVGPRAAGRRLGGTGENRPDSGSPDYIEGWCLIMRSELAREFGPFDAAHLEFAYCEDSDLCLRLQEAGYRIATADASVKHNGSQGALKHAPPPLDYGSWTSRNSRYFSERWLTNGILDRLRRGNGEGAAVCR